MIDLNSPLSDLKGSIVKFIDSGKDGDQAKVQLSYKYLDFDEEVIGALFFTVNETKYLRTIDMRLPEEYVEDVLHVDSVKDNATVSFADLIGFHKGVLARANETEILRNTRFVDFEEQRKRDIEEVHHQLFAEHLDSLTQTNIASVADLIVLGDGIGGTVIGEDVKGALKSAIHDVKERANK